MKWYPRRPTTTVWILLVLSAAPLAGQSFYIGAGLGPTVGLDAPSGSRSVYRQFFGVLGYKSAGSLGIRLEGAETFGFLWVSTDLTYSLGGRSTQPYAFVPTARTPIGLVCLCGVPGPACSLGHSSGPCRIPGAEILP
ncbi:MAG: hypothetical protein ACREA0_24940, partial [bacterium]